MELTVTVIHLLAAGIWLGGIVFTSTVVTPAFKEMDWEPPERLKVRSAVGRKYAKVANINLAILLIFAVIGAALRQWPPVMLVEIALVVLIVVLALLHGMVFAPKLTAATREKRTADRARLLRVSISISMLNLLVSLVVMVLAVVGTR